MAELFLFGLFVQTTVPENSEMGDFLIFFFTFHYLIITISSLFTCTGLSPFQLCPACGQSTPHYHYHNEHPDHSRYLMYSLKRKSLYKEASKKGLLLFLIDFKNCPLVFMLVLIYTVQRLC